MWPFSVGGHCSKSAGAERSNSGKGLTRCPSPLSPGPPLSLYGISQCLFVYLTQGQIQFSCISCLDHRTLLIQCFTYRAFLTKLKSLLAMLGYNPSKYAGHSFRRGGGCIICFSSWCRCTLRAHKDNWGLEIKCRIFLPYCPPQHRIAYF